MAVIVIDALSYHDGWISEENFAKKLHLGGKQVRKMLQFLGNQGFVAREHRRERKQGTKVESVAEQEGMVQEARQATYVCIDYPYFFDMLRLRLSLAKRQASQRIDGGEVCLTWHAVLQSCQLLSLERCICYVHMQLWASNRWRAAECTLIATTCMCLSLIHISEPTRPY